MPNGSQNRIENVGYSAIIETVNKIALNLCLVLSILW